MNRNQNALHFSQSNVSALSPISMWNLTPEARAYALCELARRAGVTQDLLASWRFQFSECDSTVLLDATGKKRLIFPNSFDLDQNATQSPARLGGLNGRHATDPLDYVVPFVKAETGAPLFSTASGIARCEVDLLGSALFTLCRYEETIAQRRDEHGRFLPEESLAVRWNFLHRPIVDEYGIGLAEALRAVLLGWTPAPRKFCVKLSHDVDLVGQPFSIRRTAGHLLKRSAPKAALQDALSFAGASLPADLNLVLEIARTSKERDLDSAFYWMASVPSAHDTGYDPAQPPVIAVIRELNERGFEQGIHPGYETFNNPALLQSQVAKLRPLLAAENFGGRQHYLRWSPETWKHWEESGLAYDSTLSHAPMAGFRAGTCIPYRPWRFDLNRPANLLEIPLIVMECTLTASEYMHLSREAALEKLKELVRECRKVGGTFTFLFHPSSLIEPAYKGGFYFELLEAIGTGEKYGWQAELRRPPLPLQIV